MGTTRVSRKDSGVSWNGVLGSGGPIVSGSVSITIAVEIVLAGADGRAIGTRQQRS